MKCILLDLLGGMLNTFNYHLSYYVLEHSFLFYTYIVEGPESWGFFKGDNDFLIAEKFHKMFNTISIAVFIFLNTTYIKLLPKKFINNDFYLTGSCTGT